jgi:hypothetical protein
MASGIQIPEHDTTEARQIELLDLFSRLKTIRNMWVDDLDVDDENQYNGIVHRYKRLTGEIYYHQSVLEQDTSVWTDDVCRDQSIILSSLLCAQYQEYIEIDECGFETDMPMQAILQLQERLDVVIQTLLGVFEKRETIDGFPEDTINLERIALLCRCKSVHELETMVVRKCIACETNPCTVRFSCGHSCFCYHCFRLFRTTPREWGLDLPCPMCRSPIILNEIQEYDSAAIEAEYVEPVVQHTHPFDDFSEPIAEQVDTYTHAMRGHNRPNDEDFDSIFGTPTRNW